jgi:hypothetical protein
MTPKQIDILVPSDEDLYNTAIDLFGVNAQIDKTVEELAELIQALMKWKGHGFQQRHFINVLEEYGDVQIMLDQFALIAQRSMDPTIHFDTLVEAEMDTKKARLYDRLLTWTPENHE